jgi:hypothetical protein
MAVSVLFGHRKGSFTSAIEDQTGAFLEASGGTLFFDEFQDLSPAVQPKLLRVLQERVIQPFGSREEIPVDVRVLIAVKRPLEELRDRGLLREDLYFRISQNEIILPPLKERLEDIPLLVDHFLKRFSATYSRQTLSLSAEGMAALALYTWPGNVRELEHMVEQLYISGHISHNPHAYELFAFHPEGEKILILVLGYFDGRRQWEVRKRHGLPCPPIYRASVPPREWKPYISSQDESFLSTLPPQYVAFAPTASSGPCDSRSIPGAILSSLVEATLDCGLTPVFLGRRFEKTLHEDPTQSGIHSEIEPPNLPGVISTVDCLSVAGSMEVVRRASITVACDSAMLHASWKLRKPTYFVCPDDRYEAESYRYGVVFPENKSVLFSTYTKESFQQFLRSTVSPTGTASPANSSLQRAAKKPMKPKVAFFTVCGGGEDYEFLLGAIEHHAEMGSHLVLDTAPPELYKRFTNLPESVLWIHDPSFGHGWKTFRLRSAVERAMSKARHLDADVLVYLDSDEFYCKDAVEDLFPHAMGAMVEIQCVHWRRDGNPYVFGESEWHPRLWPRCAKVQISANTAWTKHPQYNGNPEHHPVPVPPVGLPRVRIEGHYRHHLHYTLGQKANDEQTAVDTIDGWPDQGSKVPRKPWPPKLQRWKDVGESPSRYF